MTHDHKDPIAIPLEHVRAMAAHVAKELKTVAGDAAPIAGTGGGSLHRGLPGPLREKFIDVRAALFQRGIYDPVLVRFDTATVTQASTQEIAEQLEKWSEAV